MNIDAIKIKAQQDPVFLASVCEAETEAEIISLCSSNGLDISAEEAKEMLIGMNEARAFEKSAEELSEGDLENVAGGMVFITATTVVLFAIGLYAAYKGGEALGRWASNLRCRW